MKNAYIVDAIRTPFGRYAGGLAPAHQLHRALAQLGDAPGGLRGRFSVDGLDGIDDEQRRQWQALLASQTAAAESETGTEQKTSSP